MTIESNLCSKLGGNPPNRLKVVTGEPQTYIRTYVRTYARTYVRTYARTYARTYVRTHIPTFSKNDFFGLFEPK
jgi:hypothetical protein